MKSFARLCGKKPNWFNFTTKDYKVRTKSHEGKHKNWILYH